MDAEILAALARVERKLDLLLKALAEEDVPAEITDLDGLDTTRERDQSQPL